MSFCNIISTKYGEREGAQKATIKTNTWLFKNFRRDFFSAKTEIRVKTQ